MNSSARVHIDDEQFPCVFLVVFVVVFVSLVVFVFVFLLKHAAVNSSCTN